MVENISFWENYFLWKDAIIAAILSAAVLSYLGVWVVLKKVVYVPLALSQVSSFGVVIAFLVQDLYISFINTHHLNAHTLIDPAWVSLGLTVLLALYFAKNQQHNEISVVVSYLLASAAVLILGGFIRQDLHDIKSILFGNAVLVEPIQIIYIAIAGAIILFVHLYYYRCFLFVSFDPDSAGASGIYVFRIEFLLYATFALMISVATRAIGALPAFGLTVLPALFGLNLSKSMKITFLISIISGIISTILGYYISFIWELPTGACIVGFSGLLYIISSMLKKHIRE